MGSQDKRGKAGRRRLFAWSALLSLLSAAAIVIFVGNKYFFSNSREYNIGMLYEENSPIHQRLIDAAQMAVNDIEHASANSIASPSKLNLLFRKRNESLEEALERLYKEDVRVFVVEETGDKIVRFSENKTDVSIITIKMKTEGYFENIVEVGPSKSMLAASYLTLINNTKPNGEKVKILPVMRDESSVDQLYKHFVSAVKSYSDVSLLNPVVYTPSQYEQSDAFEIISSIGNQITLHPDAQILMLSSEDIPSILSLLHINQDLKKRRWFAVDAVHLAEEIRASARGRMAGGLVSLTTLSYLGSGEPSALKNHFLRRQLNGGDLEGTLYSEWRMYQTIIQLHTSMNMKNLDQGLTVTEILKDEMGFISTLQENGLKEGEEDSSETELGSILPEGMFISLFLMPDVKGVTIVPQIGWLLEAVIQTKLNPSGSNYSSPLQYEANFKPIKTSSLHRREIESVYENKKPNCANPVFQIHILPRFFMPEYSLEYTLEDLPNLLMLPVEGGLEVQLRCGNETSGYTCTHNKLDEGDLECRIDSRDSSRVRRDTIQNPSGWLASAFRLYSGKNDPEIDKLVDQTQTQAGVVVEKWKELAPEVIKCYASLAGCDYCYYFLSTYEISVPPAACTSGCSLGIFGACTGLLTESLDKTFNLSKEDDD